MVFLILYVVDILLIGNDFEILSKVNLVSYSIPNEGFERGTIYSRY